MKYLYIIYLYDEKTKDIKYIEEIEKAKEISRKYNIKLHSIFNNYIAYTLEDIEHVKKLNNKYIIFKEIFTN